ncbi:hypothetical protein [Nocardioides sp. InS609-2]|uniref:hypothetical protein n=1 Tax=Nocardioides sp. InS609-2 TaxID=2760705 RepID=UPI0020BED293|nr:hypothetical protein [Nocardioides sp. InS609-2]
MPGTPAEPTFGVHLVRTEENIAEIDALAGVLGGRVGLDGLLESLKWQAKESLLGRLLGRAVSRAITWDAYDRRDVRWWPQGISTSADASDTEDIGGRRVLVATWYSKVIGGVSYGSRVTFLDLDTLKYRHVLLVTPRLDKAGKLVLRPLQIHAGGVVWAGQYLHVAATSRGFVTFRLDDIMRVPGDDDHPDEFGIDDERVASYGHRYVLPLRFSYRAETDEGHTRLRYSFVSLDRRSEPPTMIAGEYGRGSDSTRLARYHLDPSTWLLETGEDGFSRPIELDDGGVVQMQGGVVAGGRYHLTVSKGPHTPGSVYVGQPGSFRRRMFATPMGPEDIAYWPSTDELWSISEHPRRRWVFAMRRSWFD